MTYSLQDRTVLVTGGARGIGAGIVCSFAAAGARVMVADIGIQSDQDTEWAYRFANDEDLAKLPIDHHRVQATHVDVTDPDSCARAVDATITAFASLDVLVDSGPVDKFSEQAWDRIFAVNCKGIFLMTQAALAHLKESDQACVINTASIAGKQGHPNMSAYCGSKFAAIGITQSMAQEFAPDNIRVNAICPGIVGTAMWLDHLLPTNAVTEEQKAQEFEATMADAIPLGRPQSAEDMGEAALYLACAENVSGIALNVSGGMQMN